MSDTPITNGVAVKDVKAAILPIDTPTLAKKPKFSWLKPHAIFVIILVGTDEQPFGIQKDLLCDRSEYYQKHFDKDSTNDALEHIVKLPDASVEVFGLAQSFMYTGSVASDDASAPTYEALIGLWRLGHDLGIWGLCEKTLHAMTECRQTTQRIPATPLLIQVWKDTPEGSSIRTLLLSWAAEYMRSSEARADFAKSLPQEVLSELVVTMSSFEVAPTAPAPADIPVSTPVEQPRKNVHYLEEGSDDETMGAKRNRLSAKISGESPAASDNRLTLNRKPSKTTLLKPQKRRSSAVHFDSRTFSPNKKLNFCADLLARMLSGPGFWTRLVGPFRDPVEPSEDGVPDYFKKVKRPMDLSTMKNKMDRKEYKSDDEFLDDMRQIFDNCFAYWKKGDPMYAAGEKLQRTFEDKYAGMNKWIAKMEGDEGE